MAATAKDYILLCMDVSPTMDIAPPSGGDTHLETAVKIANQIVVQKMFAGSKDFIGLVLFGTEDTENELALNEGGYDNISVPWQPEKPTMEFLKFLHNHVKPSNTSADFIDALVVAMDVLVRSTQNVKKVGDKKLYLLTNAGSEYNDNELQQICAGLRKEKIELIVVGPDIDPEEGDANGDGGDGGEGGDGRGGRRRPPGMKKSAQMVAGEGVLGRVVRAVDGVSFSFNEALQVSTFIRKTAKLQRSKFNGHLELGTELKIPCKMFIRTMKERPSTWKKLSAVSEAAAQPGTMAVKQQRSYHLNDEDETEVEPDSVAKGYRYGKSLVPISDADELAMKFEAPRCLSLLGFTKKEHVCQHQTLGSSVSVVVASDEEGGRAMSALIHALYETGCVGVARYVWRNNGTPKLMALSPQIKASHEALVLSQLPFMEDCRQHVFSSLPGDSKAFQPTDEQKNAIDGLITNMDLMQAEVDEDGEKCEALKTKNISSPIIQRVFQCVSHRALNPAQPLPPVEANIARLLQPSSAVMAQCQADLNRIKEVFPLTRVEEKASKENVWKKTSDLDLETAGQPPAAKRARGEEGGEEEATDFSMAALARGEVTQVGTLDPVADFRSLVAKNDSDIFDRACVQIQCVVVQLVKESFGDALYSKALDCVTALRDESIKHSKPEQFNNFLRELKADLVGTRYSVFWSGQLEPAGLTLVDSSECAASTVSPEEARDFVSAAAVPSQPSPPPPDESEDADDLLAMM